jgi:glycosyltransferase involved in cell wall biosynthesis
VQNYNIPADKIEVVYNAIDLDDLPPHTYDRRTYNYVEDLKSQGYTVFGSITRLTVQKGLAYFVRAAARALEVHEKLAFVLLGTGEQRDELIELAAELGISDRFIFGGFVRGKQWRDAYHLLDGFVMTSVSEPFGLTALEAAHHDTALLISKQSGVGEILQHVKRFDYWDVDLLANQMVEIAQSQEVQHALKQGARDEYANISWGDAASQMIRLYREAALHG